MTTYAYSAAGTATGYGGYNSSVTNISGYYAHGSLEDFQGYASSGSVAAQGANTGGGGHANQSGNSGYCIMRYSEEFDDATVTGSPTMYINQGFKIYRFTGNGTLTF